MEFEREAHRHYKLNKFFLKLAGLWPYSVSIYVKIYRIIGFLILISCAFTQFANLRNSTNLDRMLYNLTFAVPTLIYLLKYTVYMICADDVKKLLQSMWNDWKTLENEKELEIMRRNTLNGIWYRNFFFGSFFPVTIGFVVLTLTPNILDLIYPSDKPRGGKLFIIADYFFIDDEKYFFLILTYQCMMVQLGMTSAVATEGLNTMYAFHACALFEICGYRLRHAFDELVSLSDNEKYIILRARIAGVIKSHSRSIQYMDFVREIFNTSYALLLSFGIITIVTNMYRFIQTFTSFDDWEELVIIVVFVVGQYTYLFFANFFAQKITNYSNYIHDMALETLWYTAPAKFQKDMLLILQTTMKGYLLSISGLIVASLECFASLTSMTLSYFTILYSLS